MASVWLTYAWDDNKEGDVNFVIQELRNYGIDVKTDRWNINAGEHLWTQIEKFIQDPDESSAWLIYLSQNSLASKPCREEYVYALDRALDKRSTRFPIIGISNGNVEHNLIPTGVKARLYVTLRDPDWKERIKASLENRVPNINIGEINPYHFKIHQLPDLFIIELRPRAGTWSPFFVAIPLSEKDQVNPVINHGASGTPSFSGFLSDYMEYDDRDRDKWIMKVGNEATSTQSYFIQCNTLPTEIVFGKWNDTSQYYVKIK